jgi:hypothetical protein
MYDRLGGKEFPGANTSLLRTFANYVKSFITFVPGGAGILPLLANIRLGKINF